MIDTDTYFMGLCLAVVTIGGMVGCASGPRTLEIDNERTGTSDPEWKSADPVRIQNNGRKTIDIECVHGVDDLVVDMADDGEKVTVNYKCANDR
jgi:hypothetical protein